MTSGSPKVQQDTAHMTQRLAALTGGQPTFLRVPGVVPSPEMREAILSRDPHAREALTLLDSLDLALIGAGPCEVVAPLHAGRQLLHPGAVRRGRPGRARWVSCACGSSMPTERPSDTPMNELVIGVTLGPATGGRLPVDGGRRARQVRDHQAALVGRWVDMPGHRHGHRRASGVARGGQLRPQGIGQQGTAHRRSGPDGEVVGASCFEPRPLGNGASVDPRVGAVDRPPGASRGASPPTAPGARRR